MIVLTIAFSIVAYATSGFIEEYRQYDVRTEIRVIEGGNLPFPDVVICRHDFRYNTTLFCRDGVSIYSSDYSCNGSLDLDINVTSYYPEERIEDLSRQIKHVNHPQLCVRINSTGLSLRMAINARARAGNLKELHVFFLDQKQTELTTLEGGQFLNRLGPGEYEITIYGRKVYKRLGTPYPSNCSNGEDIDLVFPGDYTATKCRSSYVFRAMLSKCGSVPDAWKPYVKSTYPSKILQNVTVPEINRCLSKVFDYNRPFPCPVQCEEVTYQAKEMKIADLNSVWNLDIMYALPRTTLVKEIATYPLNKLLSDVGGWLGLFVGLSIISLVEIIVYIARVIAKKCFH